MTSVRITPRYGNIDAAVSGGVGVPGGGVTPPAAASHLHNNLDLLQRLTFDVDTYLLVSGAKVKAGYADSAAEAAHAADADAADYATQSGNADTWDGSHKGDLLDQPVRTTDEVAHKSVTAEAFKSKGYVAGGFAGAGSKMDDEGIETDNLVVRKSMTVTELLADRISATVGKSIKTIANGKAIAVEEAATSYKISLETDGGTLPITFGLDDQVMCHRLTGKSISYYWRRCTAIGAGYIELSKTDCDAGSGVPAAGDELVTMGNKTNAARQNFIIEDGPGLTIDMYKGCKTYELAPYFQGRFGDLTDKGIDNLGIIVKAGRFENVTIGPGASGLENLEEWQAKQELIDSANSKIDNLKIGGVNLIRLDPAQWEAGAITVDTGSLVASTSDIRTISAFGVVAGEEYTLSVQDGVSSFSLFFYDDAGNYIEEVAQPPAYPSFFEEGVLKEKSLLDNDENLL